jgi:hypothetical protein
MPTQTNKPWFRPRNLVLLVIAILLTAVGRQVYLAVTAKPGQSIDFAAKLQDLVDSNQPKEVPPGSPDGWPILIDAIARRATAEERIWPAAERQSAVPLDYSALFAPAVSKTYDSTHSWDAVRARAMVGLQALRDEGVFARLDELTHTRRAVRPIPKGKLIEILLPELGATRALARAEGARMYLAHQANDGPEFTNAYEQTLALGRTVGLQTFLIEHLVGIAIVALADNQLREALTEKPFDAPTCRALLAGMDRQLPLSPIANAMEAERLSTLDTIQWTHTDDGHGSGRLIMSSFRQLSGAAGNTSSSWLDSVLEWRILNLGGLAFPSKASSIKKANEFFDLVVSYSRLSPAERIAAGNTADAWLQRLPKRYVILHVLVPALDKALSARTQLDMTNTATRLMLALEIYNAEKGRYPDSLSQLVPSVLPAIPPDPCNAAGVWGYKLLTPEQDTVRRADGTPRPYLLYSFGVDGKDNDGKVAEKNPYAALRLPAGLGFDWIANEPRTRPKPEPVDETPTEAPTETPDASPPPAQPAAPSSTGP